MNCSSIISPETWKGLALEAAWRMGGKKTSARFKSTWPLPPRELERASILWPSHYQWPASAKWVSPLLEGLQQYVAVKRSAVTQSYPGVVLIVLILDGRAYDIAIDYSDRPHINTDCARECAVYFKMQFSQTGYPLSNVVPGGFVPNASEIFEYLPRLREIASSEPKSFDVYGRFGLEFAADVRRKACTLLANQRDFRWEGGLTIKRYSLALREVAASKICIDLPGNGDFCFRLVDYLAIGTCIIAMPHRTALHVPLVDRQQIVYAREDLSDLVDLCNFYLAQDDEREKLANNSRAYFDKYLAPRQMAAYYLRCCFDRLF